MIARGRAAFTLVELLVALVLLMVVGGGLATAVATQWRSHDALIEAHRGRQALGGAADLLFAELRALSPAAGDIAVATDTALEVHATLGAAVLCSLSLARDRIMVPPRQPVAGAALTWWRDMPLPGDSIDIVDGRGTLPDSVSRHEMTFLSGGRCPLASGFVRSAADAASSLEIGVSPPLPPSIGMGAPLRFLRWTRYSLYRSTTDNRWYLGLREMRGGSWTVIQPVAGSFAAPLAAGRGGMAVRLLDTSGVLMGAGSGPFSAARAIELSFRVRGTRPPRALGRTTAAADSLHVVVAPRNE